METAVARRRSERLSSFLNFLRGMETTHLSLPTRGRSPLPKLP